MTTATDGKVELQQRREVLRDQLTGLKSQRDGIAADLASADDDWTAALREGADVQLPAQRRRHREQELADLDRSIEQVTGWLAEVDAEIATLAAHEQLRHDAAEYAKELAAYTEHQAALANAPTAALEAVYTALGELTAAVDAGRRQHEHLTVRSGALRSQAESLGVPVDVQEPPRWTSSLESTHRNGELWQLVLSCIQSRGDRNILNELSTAVIRKRM